MKNVKDVLNSYEEAPSSDVWKRMNARLDEELPVQEKVSHLRRVKVWKWTAAVLTVLITGGVLTIGVVSHHRGNQNIITKNDIEVVEKEAVDISDAVMEKEATVEPKVVPASENSIQTLQQRNVGDNSMEKHKVQPNTPEETVTPQTNARQIVLPPNSTLAKQVAADPVLKKLSDDSVDWSLPVHFTIPNLFTPNNDGVNDFFVIEGLENYSSPRLVVRDKNNKVVYQNNAYKNTWGGENCPDGVYSYEFTFVFSGIENQATGRVRIIRS